jgi:hypothetical protein
MTKSLRALVWQNGFAILRATERREACGVARTLSADTPEKT